MAKKQTKSTQEPLNIQQSIAYVMRNTGVIGKTGKNKFHNYTYSKEIDIYYEVRNHMFDIGLVCTPMEITNIQVFPTQTRKGDTWHIIYGTVRFLWTAADGSTMQTEVFAGGVDGEDKAPYKLMTGAEKYCLQKTFKLPTDDDPENAQKAFDNKTQPVNGASQPPQPQPQPQPPVPQPQPVQQQPPQPPAQQPQPQPAPQQPPQPPVQQPAPSPPVSQAPPAENQQPANANDPFGVNKSLEQIKADVDAMTDPNQVTKYYSDFQDTLKGSQFTEQRKNLRTQVLPYCQQRLQAIQS